MSDFQGRAREMAPCSREGGRVHRRRQNAGGMAITTRLPGKHSNKLLASVM
jgi:hypothetical protein